MKLKIKDKNIILTKTILYNEIVKITGVFLWIKDPDPVFSRIRTLVTQKDRIRPDPDPQHCFFRLKVFDKLTSCFFLAFDEFYIY